ncbi:MAG: type 4a pilus biogenesis protein PilO [Candidatus Omnitrophica bacterium]|nr:type 4a pilus biogenesis protein PilO [Candidatus Omnitrophota bacterium]MDD5488541.1 type 4a pilus biogenesis protein PilO [Candidatus Omnitrophota bacterium]
MANNLNIDVKQIMDLYKKAKALPKQQKMLLTALGVVCISLLYMNAVYKPKTAILKYYKGEVGKYLSMDETVRVDTMATDEKESKVSRLQRVIDDLDKKIGEMEKGLPTQGKIPQVLGEFVSLAETNKIDITSIKPEYPDEPINVYKSMIVMLKMTAEYGNILNFVSDLEGSISFVGIDNILIREKTGEEKNLIESEIKITALLKNTPEAMGREESLDDIEVLSTPETMKDPFAKEFKKSETKEKPVKEDLTVSGITLAGSRSTAIINGKIYKLDDKIGERTVSRIERNYIVLKDGETDYVLTLYDPATTIKGDQNDK